MSSPTQTSLPRSLLVSSGSCGVAYVVASVLLDVTAGRVPRVPPAIGFAVPLTVTVAVVGLLVQWPILRALHSRNPKVLVSVGALLSIVPFAVLFGMMLLFFRDPNDDPGTLAGFVRFWMRVPGEFLVPFLPIAFAGGLLGWFAREARVECQHA